MRFSVINWVGLGLLFGVHLGVRVRFLAWPRYPTRSDKIVAGAIGHARNDGREDPCNYRLGDSGQIANREEEHLAHVNLELYVNK